MSGAVDSLNGLLRGEISAVETYEQAMDKLDQSTLAPILEKCRAGHAERVAELQSKIASLGGQPCESSGVWGAFAKFMEGSATALGEKPSIDILEEGEDHGLKAYRDELEKCDCSNTRSFIQNELLPGQEETHAALSSLKRITCIAKRTIDIFPLAHSITEAGPGRTLPPFHRSL